MRNSNIELLRIVSMVLAGHYNPRTPNSTSALPHFAYGLHTEQGS